MQTSVLLAIVGGVVLVAFVYWAGMLSFLYDVKCGESGLELVAFSFITFSTLTYSEIKGVKEVGLRGLFACRAINLTNRSLAKTFLVERKKGSYGRPMLVTPADVTQFESVLAKNGVECT